jgi:hypothetical protein
MICGLKSYLSGSRMRSHYSDNSGGKKNVQRKEEKNMRRKIIGMLVIVLMITTILPVSGTLQESEQKNSVENQKYNIASSFKFIMGIGLITNRIDYGYGYYTCNAVFVLIFTNGGLRPWWRPTVYHSHEYLEIGAGRFDFCGKHFAFFCYRYRY